MQEQAELSAVKDILFTLKEITYTPESPRLKTPFTVKGKIELFKIPFLAPIWVQARVTYPEAWWEEIIPIIGSPTIAEGAMVIGGDFEISFPRGFDREGEFLLEVNVYAGPTYSIDKVTIPPFPPVTSYQTTFLVAGEVPPEEVGFRSFRILSYSKNDGPPVTPPGVLELDIGDRCRVNVGFDHMNGEVTGKFHAAIWQKRVWDPHDEVLNADKSFSVPSSPDWQPFENYIDIPITSAISPGTEYGLYVKIMGITGGDIFTEYLANVITIKGVPAVGECRELKITSYDSVSPPSVLEVDLGDTIRVTSEFDYFGPATTGKLYSALWHPSWYDPHDEIAHGEKSITLPDSPEGNHITGYVDIKVPSGFSGTDFGLYTKVTGNLKDAMSPYYDNIITITKEVELETLEVRIYPVGAGYVTVSPTPAGGVQHNWLFPYGTIVYVTAHPNPGYVFNWWSGEMTDTPDITAPVYLMTEHRLITAHFEEAPPEKVSPDVDTLDARDITHDSTRFRGELVDTGYWNVVDCYFEWGKTTGYGNKTPKERMYEGDEGSRFYAELLHYLEAETTYHYRAVAITVGINGELTGYGSDRSFTTEKEVVKGFTMRVVNARAGSVYWRAACVAGGGLPSTPSLKLDEVWVWTGAVPDYTLDFFVWSGDADKKTTQHDEFPFRLRTGKNYLWDFAAHEMREV